ncbi:MAG: bacterio-opsin activator domain-containing protein [Salinigranum sp.]
MNPVILASIVLRVVGVGYSGVLLYQSKDRRFGFLSVMLALMTTRQVLSARTTTTTAIEELPGLAVSALAVLTVYYLSAYVEEERRITDQLEGFRKAVEHAGHAIFLTDTDGTIEYANPAVESVTGYEREEVVGENPRLWQSGEHDDTFYESMWDEITAGTVWDGEIINRRKSGELCWVDVTIAPITDEGGEVERFVAVERDVTERKERQLHIEEQNERLELLNNTNEVLRDVNRELVAASTREEIERAVCERFASSDLFDAAWIGDAGLVEGTIRQRTVAGVDDATAEAELETLQSVEPSPVARAREAAGPVFVSREEMATDVPLDAAVVVPLAYQEADYGVLVVSATRADAFEAIDRTLFADLGATVADAVSAVQSKQTLGSDDVTELEFRLDTIEAPLVRLSAALDCAIELEQVTSDADSDGGRALYCTVRNADPEGVERHVESASHLRSARRLNAYEDRVLYRLEVDETSVAAVLTQYGAGICALSVTGGEGRLVAEVSRANDVRATVEALTATYPEIDLLAQRERERDVETEAAFRARLEESLTPRQLEAARTAHFAGFFAWPREQSGEEVAETMGITQATFTQHLRAAEQKLFGALFDGGV